MRNLLWLCLGLLFVMSCQEAEKEDAFPGLTGDYKTLPTGYTYVVHKSNANGRQPGPGDYVYFHAQIRKNDSLVMASRDQGVEPVMVFEDTPNANETAGPIGDLLMQMHEGDSASFAFPYDSMEQPIPGFGPGETAIFDVVSLNVHKRSDIDVAKEQVDRVLKAYNEGTLDDISTMTASGMKMVPVREGTGEKAEVGNFATASYYGILTDGTMFDNSFAKGAPLGYPQPFPIGQGAVIAGWDEALSNMREGEQVVIVLPPDLAYGAGGSPPAIPGGATLIFFMELESVVPGRQMPPTQ